MTKKMYLKLYKSFANSYFIIMKYQVPRTGNRRRVLETCAQFLHNTTPMNTFIICSAPRI